MSASALRDVLRVCKGANARVEELMKELRGMVGLTEVKESACAHSYILSKELQ